MGYQKKTIKELLPSSIGILAFIISIFFSYSVLSFLGKASEDKQKSEMIVISENTNSLIYSTLMRNLSKVFALSALVTDDGNMTPAMENQFEGMIQGTYITSLIFAPKGIVKSVYPYEHNKGFLGLSFFHDFPEQLEFSKLKNSTDPYFVGPYIRTNETYREMGIIFPVFKPDSTGKRVWWGVVFASVDFEKFLTEIDLSEINKKGYSCKIWKSNEFTKDITTIYETEIPVKNKYFGNQITVNKQYFQATWNYTFEPLKKNLTAVFYISAILLLILDLIIPISVYFIIKNIQESQFRKMYKMQSEIVKMQEHTIISLSSLVENRDSDTGEHVRRTSDYVYLLAKEAQKRGLYADVLTNHYIELIRSAAPMHDIGKIVVPDAVLKKPARLTPEEFMEIRKHTIEGGRIIQDVIGPVQTPEYVHIAREIAVYHHEKCDGTGYPYGLAKEDIPISARIMALADVFDALTAPRCYKEPFSFEKAMNIITMESRFHFDPALVEVFVACESQLKEILHKYS